MEKNQREFFQAWVRYIMGAASWWYGVTGLNSNSEVKILFAIWLVIMMFAVSWVEKNIEDN